ncbi:MAG TPA: hypothetical protein VFG50_09755, partial [Rhodothermales bacterium]|nr:hypothetical protein [Rhodothermales bacterium]
MNDGYVYQAYGLVIQSDVALAELLPYSGSLEPGVEVRRGTVHQKPPPEAPQGCFQASPGEACFAWEEYGSYLI